MKRIFYILFFISSFCEAQIINSYAYTIYGAVPVVETFTTAVSDAGVLLNIAKPTGVAVNDLLLIFLYNDTTSGANSWDDVTNKPSGFTLISQTDTSDENDARFAAFYRIADGTETATIDCPQVGTSDQVGYYIRVSGVSTTTPLNTVGTPGSANGLSHPVPGITTTLDNCLVFYVAAADGGDTRPMSVSGTGWVEGAENSNSGSTIVAAGTWGTKEMPTSGATGTCTITLNVSDGLGAGLFGVNSN